MTLDSALRLRSQLAFSAGLAAHPRSSLFRRQVCDAARSGSSLSVLGFT
jgi:hypothetical protein